MILRVIILFLLFIAVMAMIQKALRPARKNERKRNALDKLRCPTCKRVNFSNKSAPCARPDCGNR